MKNKIEVIMNIRNEFRININGSVPEHAQFDTIKQMKKFAKDNGFVKTYNRLDHRSSCGFYNKDSYDKVILIVEGEFQGSFACVNDMGGLMSVLDNNAKRNAWTMTRGNKGNDVEKFSEFDKTRWVINKNYEAFTKQSTEGKGSLNHFKQAKKLHEDSWKHRLAQFMATLSEEELAEIEMERAAIVERNEEKKATAKPKTKKKVEVKVEVVEVENEFDIQDYEALMSHTEEEVQSATEEELEEIIHDEELDALMNDVGIVAPEVRVTAIAYDNDIDKLMEGIE